MAHTPYLLGEPSPSEGFDLGIDLNSILRGQAAPVVTTTSARKPSIWDLIQNAGYATAAEYINRAKRAATGEAQAAAEQRGQQRVGAPSPSGEAAWSQSGNPLGNVSPTVLLGAGLLLAVLLLRD